MWSDPKAELVYVQETLKWAREREREAQRIISRYAEQEQSLLEKLQHALK